VTVLVPISLNVCFCTTCALQWTKN